MDSIRFGEILGGQIIPTMIGLYLGWRTVCWFRKDSNKDKEEVKQ